MGLPGPIGRFNPQALKEQPEGTPGCFNLEALKDRPGGTTGRLNPQSRRVGALFVRMFHGKHDGETTRSVSRET